MTEPDFIPTPTPDCCEVWPRMLAAFDWMAFTDNPAYLAMPHVQDGDTKWRVKHCPACGADRRSVIVARKQLAELMEN